MTVGLEVWPPTICPLSPFPQHLTTPSEWIEQASEKPAKTLTTLPMHEPLRQK
jgi:hypothetical protein